MSFKYTVNTLKKMEQLFEAGSYTIRYERGNFNSGCCVLEEKRVIVVNRFLSVEGRINALVELLIQVKIAEDKLNPDMQKWLRDLRQNPTFINKSVSVQTKMDI